jgi:hypothetical protein
MPTFIALTKWKPEDRSAVLKELFGSLGAPLPEGVKLCSAYHDPQQFYGIWEAPSKEVLEKGVGKLAPTIKKYTEFLPVVQCYPPSLEFVMSLWQQISKAAPK